MLTLIYFYGYITVERTDMGEKRNHSDVPPGDEDPLRQAFRGGMTSYHWDMKAVSIDVSVFSR